MPVTSNVTLKVSGFGLSLPLAFRLLALMQAGWSKSRSLQDI